MDPHGRKFCLSILYGVYSQGVVGDDWGGVGEGRQRGGVRGRLGEAVGRDSAVRQLLRLAAAVRPEAVRVLVVGGVLGSGGWREYRSLKMVRME